MPDVNNERVVAAEEGWRLKADGLRLEAEG
jgi:hypothetical protein